MIKIINGKILEGENTLVDKEILIKDDKIVKIEDKILDYADEIIDAKGGFIMPGATDVHVHFREPGFEAKETIKTGTLASAKGGFTCVMPMPNLNPTPDDLKSLNVELEIIKRDAKVKCFPYATLTKKEEGKELSNLDELAPYVKAFSDDGKGVNNLDLLYKGMEIAKKYNLPIACHAETVTGKTKPEGEYEAVIRDIEIAKKTGARYHFCHMSTKESIDAIKKARDLGYNNITYEITPHHLVLNEDMIKDGNWKMNPPLRSEDDRKRVEEALISGEADIIACDHAPHTEEEKNQDYLKCPNGIIGIETELPIIYHYFVKSGKISLRRFLDVLVYNPNRIFNLPEHDIKVGSIADIAILDINNLHTYTKDEILSKGTNCPYIGMSFYGFNICTILDGKVIYKA